MISSDDVPELLSSFPPVEFAFAYGSGVVEQGGYSYSNVEPSKLPMLDLILVVDNAEQWHTDNRVMNDDHYTPMLPLGSKYIARFQERIPAHLWFNAYVPMTSKNFKGRLMKYGVISKEHLLADLTSWTNLYTAGRLQKPVHVLKDNELIRTAMNKNLESAVRTSLLMLPTQFEEIDLYLSIASLSYVGDPRMYLGENPKKVVNLVTPIVPHYQELYRSALDSLASADILTRAPSSSSSNNSSSGSGSNISSNSNIDMYTFTQNTSRASRWALCQGLPGTIKQLLSIRGRAKYLHSRPPNAAAVRTAVSSVVARAASLQTLKGLFTVGLWKGANYALAKVWCRRTVGLASSTGRMDLKVSGMEGGKHSVVATFEHLVPVDDLFDEEY